MKKLLSPSQMSSYATEMTKLQAALSAQASVPEEIITWLARLKLLYGLPFNYLVPDEQMLPRESIRFFQIDPNWIDSLVDGAFSLGRATQGDHTHDQAHHPTVAAKANQAVSQIRPKALASNEATETVLPAEISTISGFLLRSSVVADWPGLEVDACPPRAKVNDPCQKLAILRMERLSPNVLLCLFGGLIDKIFIHEPIEGLHFGVDVENLQLCKKVWQISQDPPKSGINTRTNIANDIDPLPMRAGNKRVLDIQALAQTMANDPSFAETRAKEVLPSFTAAEFALQMVEGVDSVRFGMA